MAITYAFITTGHTVASSTNFTVTAAAIGTASANRRVVVLLTGQSKGGRTLSSATIGGIAATVHYEAIEATNAAWSAAISAIVPTGTTADITVVMSGSISTTPRYSVYTIDNSTISTPVVTTTNTNTGAVLTLAATYTAVVGSLTFCAIGWPNITAKNPVTLTSYTLDSATSDDGSAFSRNGEPASGSVTDTVNWTSVSTSAAIGVLSFPPVAGITVALTGTQATSSRGAITLARTIAIAGIQATASRGAITLVDTLALSGIQATSSRGAITLADTLSIAGIQATASQGVVSLAGTVVTVALAGIQAASSQGSIILADTLAPSGIQATASQGVVMLAGALALAGIQATASQGVIVLADTLALAGIQATASQGAITRARDIAIAGIQATASQGVVTLAGTVSVALVGIQATAAQGVIALADTLVLAGIQATASQGVVALANTLALAGIQATASQGAITLADTLALAGIQATASLGTATFAGTVITTAIAGIQASAAQGAIIPAVTTALAGIQATASQGAVIPAVTTALAGIQATSSQGVVALAGSPIVVALTGIQATAFQGIVTSVAVAHRPRRPILRAILDIRAIASSGRVGVRSGKATIVVPEVINAIAMVELTDHIGAHKPAKVMVKAHIVARVAARSGIPAAIYWEKEATISTTSTVHTTSRVVTVLSGMPSIRIIAAAYPDGSLTPIRSGDVSYVYTTRYS